MLQLRMPADIYQHLCWMTQKMKVIGNHMQGSVRTHLQNLNMLFEKENKIQT